LEDIHPAVLRCQLEQVGHFQSQDLTGVSRVLDMVFPYPGLQFLDQRLAGIPADSGLDEQHLEVFVELLVELSSVEEFRDFIENALTSFLEPLFDLDIRLCLAPE